MRVSLHRSRGLLLYLVVIHGLAGMLLVLLNLDSFLTLLISVLLVVSLMISCKRYGWLKASAHTQQLLCDSDERWTMTGKYVQVGTWILQHSVILGPLIILRFRPLTKKRTRSVVVLRDAVDAETWRQLCLKLRDPEIWD